MTEKTRFRLEYPSGHMDVIVREFFGTSEKKKIKKLLRLAKQHASEEQREYLLNALKAEDKACKTTLDGMKELHRQQSQLLSAFFGNPQWYQADYVTSAEKDIMRRQAKLQWSIEQVENERWVG